MNLDQRIINLMPPPEKALEIPSDGDWARCEQAVGKLPADYREFLAVYGTGAIDFFLWVYNPASLNENLNLLNQQRVVLDDLRVFAQDFPEYYPMPIFPDPGGFLPFAGTDNGDNIFWVAEGAPDTWHIALMGGRAPEVFHFNGGLSDFLVAILSRKFDCFVLPEDFPSEEKIEFIPRLF